MPTEAMSPDTESTTGQATTDRPSTEAPTTAGGRSRVAALGAEGWFTTDGQPALIGQRCNSCGTYVFPRAGFGCPNPACDGTDFDDVALSSRGSIWSYTDARYQPPAPFVVLTDAHQPFCIAAVHLAEEGLVVMGSVVAGVSVEDLSVGQEVKLVVDVLFSDDDTDHLVWKWAPLDWSPPDRTHTGTDHTGNDHTGIGAEETNR